MGLGFGGGAVVRGVLGELFEGDLEAECPGLWRGVVVAAVVVVAAAVCWRAVSGSVGVAVEEPGVLAAFGLFVFLVGEDGGGDVGVVAEWRGLCWGLSPCGWRC